MIQEYNCYGDGDMVAVKAGRGNWVRYSDHLAEVERAVDVAIEKALTACPEDLCLENMNNPRCIDCLKTRVMEELKK